MNHSLLQDSKILSILIGFVQIVMVNFLLDSTTCMNSVICAREPLIDIHTSENKHKDRVATAKPFSENSMMTWLAAHIMLYRYTRRGTIN